MLFYPKYRLSVMMKLVAQWLLVIGWWHTAFAGSNGAIRADLINIRFRESLGRTNSCVVSINVSLTNCDEKAYCFLPSQAGAGYVIHYDDGQHDAASWGRMTINSSAHHLDDLEMPCVVLRPHGAGSVEMLYEGTFRPKLGKGALRMDVRQVMGYTNDLYRGVSVCRDVLPIQGAVEVTFKESNGSNEWTITPVPGPVGSRGQ